MARTEKNAVRTEKAEAVEALKKKFSDAAGIILTSQRLLSHDPTNLRKHTSMRLGVVPHMRAVTGAAAPIRCAAFPRTEVAVRRPPAGLAAQHRQLRTEAIQQPLRQVQGPDAGSKCRA